MTSDPGDGEAPVGPDRAFALLGNETRVRVLRTLALADGPLSFTELRNRVGLGQGEQFNYHLSKLVGHFVEKTEAGYSLRRPGQRVVEAILSGAITEDPEVAPTPVDSWACPYCGGTVEVRYRAELVERYCTECEALFGDRARPDGPSRGNLGGLWLPPAGVAGRDADELLTAAFAWGYAQWLLAAKGICPRCSARVERSVDVCVDHDAGNGFCDRCGERYAVSIRTACTNCPASLRSVASMHLAATPELLSFALDHGIDPLADPWDWGWVYDEEVLTVDPFEGRFTFTVDGDSITVTVDEDLAVVRAERTDPTDGGA